MKITVIGEWGGYPKVNGASSGYLIEHKGYHLLLDCGSGVLAQLQNYLAPEKLDAVIISHYHPDHIADIGVLQHARLIQGFLGKQMNVLPIFGHPYDQNSFQPFTYKKITKGIHYDPNRILTVGPFSITFLKTIHPVTCYAMRIVADEKVLVYTADSAYQEAFITFCDQADLLLSDCNFYGDQIGKDAGHMNSYDNGKLASTAKVKMLILSHLPHYGQLAKLIKEAAEFYSGPIQLAKSGLTITL